LTIEVYWAKADYDSRALFFRGPKLRVAHWWFQKQNLRQEAISVKRKPDEVIAENQKLSGRMPQPINSRESITPQIEPS
jgi:hypothetical protein